MHPDMPNWVRLVVPRKGLTEYTTMHMSEHRCRSTFERTHISNRRFKHRIPSSLLRGPAATDDPIRQHAGVRLEDHRKCKTRLVAERSSSLTLTFAHSPQTAFIHDFVKLPKGQADTTSEYGEQMQAVLRSLSVPAGHPAVKMMRGYDMSSTGEARIVASIPTIKPLCGWPEIEKYGLGRLHKMAQSIIGKKTKGGCTMEAQVRRQNCS
jgi:hypothetical protein